MLIKMESSGGGTGDPDDVFKSITNLTTGSFTQAQAWSSGSINVPSGAKYAYLDIGLAQKGGGTYINIPDEMSRIYDSYSSAGEGANTNIKTFVKLTTPTLTIGFDTRTFNASVTWYIME